MPSEPPMWRLTYSPAPESGIRSTLQPNSPIYQTAIESEEDEEDESSLPNSPPHSSPIENYLEDDDSDTATPTPEPVPSQPPRSTGPSRIYLRVPPLDPTRKSSKGKTIKVTSSSGRRRASTSATPSAISSRQNSQNLDGSDNATSLLQSYILDEQGHKRYPCLRCDKQFGRSHDRKRHMEESTSCRGGLGSTVDTEVQPMWVCERCGDSFSRRDSMNRHQKNPDACKAYKRLLR